MLTANRLRARKSSGQAEAPRQPAPPEWPVEAIKRIGELEREAHRLRVDLVAMEQRAVKAEGNLEEANEQLLQRMLSDDEEPAEVDEEPAEVDEEPAEGQATPKRSKRGRR